MTRGSLAIVLLVTACGGKVEPEAVTHVSQSGGKSGVSGGGKTGLDSTGATGQVVSALCKDDNAIPPNNLSCSGLYSDVKKKALSKDIRAYAPAVPLWSDGAEKKRWIYIPKGKKIDVSNPNEWIFPIGTKIWKEFAVGGKRIETRLFQKKAMGNTGWVHTTYAWNDDETEAVASIGGDMPMPDGSTYHIPVPGECEQCHRGRTDRVLGFEQVSLGLQVRSPITGETLAATGVTLADLVKDDLLDPPPDMTTLTIGDDGTGLAAYPLAWLHVNCGVTCHNDNSGSTAFGAGMKLRLDPAQLDGRAVNDFDAVKTTLGLQVNTPTWHGQTRIVPGDASGSLLVQLITTRSDAVDPSASQMPPIASRVVDTMDAQTVIDWIAAMPKSGGGGG